MKTWEMIKELTGNPEKKFIRCGSTGESYVTVTGWNKIEWVRNGQFFSHFEANTGQDDWCEVKQPVTFMEAVESGKKIKVKHIFSFKKNTKACQTEAMEIYKILAAIAVYPDWAIKEILTQGNWYIED